MQKESVYALVSENLKTIYAYSLSRVSNKSDAEDLAGDIVLAILESAPRLRDEHAFFGFIWAIAANTYKKFLHKRALRVTDELDETLSDTSSVEEAVVASDEHNRLRRELSILSHEHRECTVMYYVDGLSCTEIAKKLSVSVETVKYYLFKTRKILKEGIVMERQFGEKSYRPAPFVFATIFSGNFNREYQNMFKRKLPGNILVSAYYTPMSIRELSIELGVAAVYLEDELDLLVKYGLMTVLPSGKYQTSLVIFTEDFTKEFIRAAERECRTELAEILENVRRKLPAVRSECSLDTYSDGRIMWALLFPLMCEGNSLFEKAHPGAQRSFEIHEGATGTVYGIDYEEEEDEYSSPSFAGYSLIDETRYAKFADFGILPESNQYSRREKDLENAVTVSEDEYEKIKKILSDEIEAFSSLYSHLAKLAAEIMLIHAPKSVSPMVNGIIEQTVFFRSAGLIGALAVHSGALTVPEDGLPASLICIKIA